MRLQAPIRLQSKLSRHSIIALVGLVAFATMILVANPFGGHATGGGFANTANTSAPSTVGGGTQPTQQGGGSGAGTGGQGSLITGTLTPTQSEGGGFGTSGSDHHHHDDGDSTDS